MYLVLQAKHFRDLVGRVLGVDRERPWRKRSVARAERLRATAGVDRSHASHAVTLQVSAVDLQGGRVVVVCARLAESGDGRRREPVSDVEFEQRQAGDPLRNVGGSQRGQGGRELIVLCLLQVVLCGTFQGLLALQCHPQRHKDGGYSGHAQHGLRDAGPYLRADLCPAQTQLVRFFPRVRRWCRRKCHDLPRLATGTGRCRITATAAAAPTKRTLIGTATAVREAKMTRIAPGRGAARPRSQECFQVTVKSPAGLT